MSANSLVGTYGTLQFASPPLRGNAERHKKHQSDGFDSNASQYVYVKSQTVSKYTTLVYTINPLILSRLVMFRLVQGAAWFTWYDHTNTAHNVLFASGIAYKQINAFSWRVEFSLEGESQ